ncbi:two-component system sensor histidine kinase [Aquipluma nitroreducens]|uniref:histidine kinase n=1 Tax=Aquipluma nitroreducens TaxID=2010828 RepID=A0A5K7SF15_9BACT|nr:PAS domain-containing sensor histidine kinase [Aquipluma nitroreducens]BBE20168.1 two-component system sensor histidine kinase [Aquipluma nitroreducens]
MKKGEKGLAKMGMLCTEPKYKPELTYKIFFEDSGASIVIINKEGFYLFVNSRAAGNMGGKPEDILGRSILEFLPQKTAEKYLERNRKLIETGISEKYEDTFELPSGIKTFLITDHVLKDEDNKGYALQSSSVDITERKKSEEALHESEEMYRQITQNLPGTTIVLFDQNLRFLLVEGYLHPDIGFTTNQLVGKTLWELLPQARAQQLAPIYENALKGIPFENLIYEFKDRVLSLNIIPLKNNHGQIYHGLVVSHDITERRRSEQTLRENEERLRELNATKDKFFSIIAHDLKSPFNSILGLSNFIIEEMHKKKRFKNLEQYATIIRDSSQRTFGLLSNLLEWSRIQTGRLEFKPEKADIISLIEQEIELLNDSARQKKITIVTELPKRCYEVIDKDMFMTIVRNLISNAIKFTGLDGTIRISVIESEQYIEIAVSDNGIGIKKEHIENLFHIDESQSTPGTQNEKGTGLGLILCKEFVDKHGGKIWVESEPGKGSCFHFTISRL